MKKVVPKRAVLIPDNTACVFKGVIFDVYQWDQDAYGGATRRFEMLRRPDTVKIIAIKDDKIVINKEEQPNHLPFYDLPGGRHDVPSESTLQAAQRELLEETGMKFRTWKLIEVTQPFTKIEQFVYIYIATDFIEQQAPQLDSGEKIATSLLSLNEVIKLGEKPEAGDLPMKILEKLTNIQDLHNLPEFEGCEIDR